jgi:NAD(P)-dependent dehydrogenase (short-subunit alcohol dehydrogenase family)
MNRPSVFVTGAASGIGRATALHFARHGYRVGAFDVDAPGLRILAAEQSDIVTDVLDVADADAWVRALSEFCADGRLDILVNNAGGVRGGVFVEQSERSWRRHIDINLVSMLAATSAAVPVMRRGGRGGSIVNVSSIEGTRAAPNFAVYAACKAGMLSFTRTMALELAEEGIRVNAITPDQTVTPGNHGQRTGPIDEAAFLVREPALQDAMDRYIPVGREGHISESGSAVAFLCSSLASYITGATLPVDGGTWAASGWSRGIEGTWNLGDFPIG